MKHLYIAATMTLAVACAATTHDAAQGVPPDGPALRATLEPVGRPRAGGPVEVEFALTNLGQESLHVLTWYTPLEGFRSNLFVIESSAGEVRYRGPMMKRMPPPAEAYVELVPGATERRVLDLAEGYGVTEAGTYRVRFERPLGDVVPANGSVPSRPADHRPVALGPVEATVVVER